MHVHEQIVGLGPRELHRDTYRSTPDLTAEMEASARDLFVLLTSAE